MENMNTLEAYENLRRVNFTDDQSKELVRLIGKVQETEPASRRDLSETELRLKKEIADINQKTEDIRQETESIRMETKGIQKEIESIRKETENIRMQTEEIKKETQDVRLEIKNVELRLSTDIKELDTKLSVKLETIKVDFLRWLIGVAIALGGLLMAFIRYGLK